VELSAVFFGVVAAASTVVIVEPYVAGEQERGGE
jgi:hypothetical protein